MSVGEQPQDRGVIVAFDTTQPTMTHPSECCRQGIVRIVLRGLRRAQQSHSCGQRWRDIDHPLTGAQELLSEQSTKPGGGLDRPHPLGIEWFSPRQQPGRLMSIGGQCESRNGLFVAVNRDSCMGRLVRVDPDRHWHECSSKLNGWVVAEGTPDEMVNASF